MILCGDGSSGVAAEGVRGAGLGAGSQAPASRRLADPELPQGKCLPCE